MGRSRTPRYVIRIKCHSMNCTPMEWRTRRQGVIPADGKPTTANIDKWVDTFEESMKPGACNAHLGFHPVLSAEIVDQYNGNEVVASWNRKADRPKEPLFQVI